MTNVIEMLKYKLYKNQKMSKSSDERFANRSESPVAVSETRTKRETSILEQHDAGSRESPPKRQRTKEDFIAFCSFVLSYTKYQSDSIPISMSHHNRCGFSPPTGSGSENYTSDSASSVSPGDKSSHHLTQFDNDSVDAVTCHCLKPYGGRPMIECSSCSTWVHLSCAKIRKMNIPDVFTCQNCRSNAFASSRKSARVKMEYKRLDV